LCDQAFIEAVHREKLQRRRFGKRWRVLPAAAGEFGEFGEETSRA
jgi:hypothetical protein